ncbi:uncharacterized protein LOC110500882 isoform X2 [Oncorhynchus mykiss]|uniref:uncharacterized protein LOC110500882 isoform X2 n=1 Tax=Oncorhynchus mykiss TaxID=8022 RepID=UPI00187854BC|nr:uncharacterized protein LOC110500882 isoform X2 [Oncorhynchus mykiss]
MDLEDSDQEKGMEEEVEVEAEKPDAQLKEEKKVMSGKAPKKSADQGTEEVAFCSPRAHYPDKYQNRAAVIQLLHEELRKSQLYPSGMEEDACFPILINFMRNLTDRQWKVIQEGMRNPTTKVQLAKMCRKIAKTVSHIAVEILIPTLAQILELDSAGEASSSPSLTGSECANIGSIQEHVVKLNEDGLPKRPGSGRHYYSSHTPTPRSSTSSQTSLQRAHRVDVRLTDPLNALFGITEATILQTLGDQSCSPGLTRSLVRDVVSQVNSDISLIISCSSSGKSRPVLCDTGRRYAMQAAQKLVSVICAKLRRFGITGQAAPQAKTNPSKENVDIEASLAPLTGEVMAVMVNSRECQGGEQGTMDVLREITHKVNVLASRDSVGGLLEDSLAEEKNLKETVSSGSLVSPNILILSPSEKKLGSPVMTTIEKFSSGELKSEATNAISEVLIRSSRSLSAQMSACTPEHSCNLASERNLPAMPELLTTTINVGSEASEIMDSFLSDMTCIAQSDFTKMKALPAALNLSKRLQNTLRGFYSRLLAPNSSERDKEENLEQAKNISAPTLIQKLFGSNKNERMLPGIISPGEVALHRHQSESSRPMALSPQIIQFHLDSTTKEVVSTIVSCYKPEVPEEELTYSHEKMSSDTSLLATEFVDHVIAWLKVISAASSATSSSESLCVSPNALICELSSETFQTQAVKRVKQVLIESVRCFSNSGSSSISESHTSLVSQSDFGIQQDSSSTSFMSMDSSSFGVVAAVVKDMKSLLQTTESTDSLQPTDSALLHGTTSYSETSSKSWQSGVAISDFKLWSTAQTIYRHLRNNLREFFIRHHQPDVKTTDAIIMQAKKSSSQILLAIQEEMTRSEELMTSRELVQLHGIVGMMLEGVETICSEDDTEQEWQELQRPSTSLSTASKGSRSQRLSNTHTLPGTPMSTELLDSSFPVIRSTCIDASDDIASGASLSDLGKTLNGVVSFIIEHLDPEVMQQITSPDSNLTSLEELISKEKIHSLCHDLVAQLESLIREQNSIPLIKSVAVAKCVSDTVLLNLARRENQVGKPFSSKLIYMFAEELVKQLLLPLILPPSLWEMDQEASLYDVPSSSSSHRSSSSTTSLVTVLDGSSSLVSASSSQVYDDTVNLFTSAICHQVMDNISGASSHTVEDNIHDREASIIATGSVEQAQSDSSSPRAVKQGKWRFRFLPKFSKFRLNLKDLEDSHQEKGMEEEVEAEIPDAQLKEEKKVMCGKAPKKSADQGTEEGSSVAFCSPRAHYPDKYRNRAAVIQLLHEELRKSQLYPSVMEEDACFPILINFMRNLTDRQWKVIQEGMRNPTTKVQLAKMCRKIAKTVSHIAVEILIPTLAQILELDSAGEASSSPSLTGSECANIASIQEHVVKLNEDGLPKRPGSGRHYYSSHTPTPRSSTSSQTSLQRAHRVDVRLTDPLNALFGITEATILQTLGDQSCSSGSPGLTRSLVRDVVSQVNSDISLIISCSSSGKSRPVLCDTGRRYAMQAAQKLVSVICAKLRRFGITGQAAPQAKTNPSKENVDIEASLAPLTGEVMAVMVNSRECQGGEQGTMDVLREITHKVNVLASRDSVGGLLEDSLAEKNNLKETVSSGSLVSPNILILSPYEKKLGSPVMTTIEKFSSGELKSEATNAISEVLIRSSRSLSAQMSACTPEHSCNLASERNLPAMPELLTTTINVGSEASEIMDSFLSDMTCIAQSDFTKMKALPAALNLSKRLQNTLRGFYSRLLAPNSSERDKEENLEQAKNISAPTLNQKLFGSNKSERMLPGIISPGEVALHRHQSESSRLMALSPQIIQLHLDSTTKEVVSTIVSCYKPEVPEEELTYSHEKMSSDTSLLATEFVDHVIAWLKVISAASSATSSSESLCVSPNALICELSSETFQTQAVKRVKQVLIESVRCFSNSGSSSISESHTSRVSQSDFGIQQDSSSTSFMSMDSSSFGVVAAVVKDMKSLLQTTESTDSLQPTDSALLHGTTSYSETSSKSWQSGVAISDFKLWSTAQTIYRHLRNNLREFFIRHHQPDVKTTDAIIMQAKKSSSQILLAIQEEMTRSEELMTSRELVQLHGIVGMMLEGVETVCSEDDTEQEWQELQRPSTSLSTASKGSRSQRLNNTHTLPGTPMSTELLDSSFPVIRSTCIDARDDIASGASLSDLGKTLNGVVSFIIEHLDPEVMQQITSPDSDLTSLEELISKEKIHSLCHDLVAQLESLIREQNSIPLIKSVAVAKCVSDTVLLNLARRENQVGKPFSSKLIYMFAEELVKQLLLPLILPPSLWGLDQEASLYDVPSSTSSHRSSSSTTSLVTVLDGSSSLVSASSSQVYDDTVNLFTSAICHQVMDNISGASSHTVEDNIHDREASIIATGSVEQAQSDSSSPRAVKQGKWRFRFLPKFSKFRLNLKAAQQKAGTALRGSPGPD